MSPLVVGKDAIEDDEMDLLMIEAVPEGAYLGLPVFSKVKIVVMLSDHVVDLAPQFGHDLQAMIQLFLFSKLCQVASEEEKIRLWCEQVGFLDRPDETHVPVTNELTPSICWMWASEMYPKVKSLVEFLAPKATFIKLMGKALAITAAPVVFRNVRRSIFIVATSFSIL